MKIKLNIILLFSIALFTACATTQTSSETPKATPQPANVINSIKPNETAMPNALQPERSTLRFTAQENTKAEEAKKPEGSNVMMPTFDKIQKGMSYAEVAAILGSRGENAGEFQIQGGSMAMYSWRGRNEKGDWILSAKFENGRLTDKSQFGLK